MLVFLLSFPLSLHSQVLQKVIQTDTICNNHASILLGDQLIFDRLAFSLTSYQIKRSTALLSYDYHTNSITDSLNLNDAFNLPNARLIVWRMIPISSQRFCAIIHNRNVDSCNSFNTILAVFDAQLNLVKYLDMSYGNISHIASSGFVKNGLLTTIGFRSQPCGNILDSNGVYAHQWDVTTGATMLYKTTLHRSQFNDPISTLDGLRPYGAGYLVHSTSVISGSSFVMLDSNFNVATAHFPAFPGSSPMRMQKLPLSFDSYSGEELYAGGLSVRLPTNIPPYICTRNFLSIVKLDSNDQLSIVDSIPFRSVEDDCMTYAEPSNHAFDQALGRVYVAASNRSFQGLFQMDSSMITIAAFDADSGKFTWHMQDSIAYNRALMGMHVLPDSSILCVSNEHNWDRMSVYNEAIVIHRYNQQGHAVPLASSEAISADIRVYPNPVDDYLHVTVYSVSLPDNNLNITLHDYQGRFITETSLRMGPDGQAKWLLPVLPSGMYTIHLTSSDGQTLLQEKLIRR